MQKAENDDEEMGVDEEVDLDKLEEIIDFLFVKLQDKDTVVRWSAAKGIVFSLPNYCFLPDPPRLFSIKYSLYLEFHVLVQMLTQTDSFENPER